MKPDITFFGEALPDRFSERLTGHDKALVDLVIVIGTSLKVAPVSEVVPYLPAHIPQMYISRTPVSHVNFDVDMLGDCDVVVAELCRRAGWDLAHEMVPEDQKVRSSCRTALRADTCFSLSRTESGSGDHITSNECELGEGWRFLCKGFDALHLDWTGQMDTLLALAFSERCSGHD